MSNRDLINNTYWEQLNLKLRNNTIEFSRAEPADNSETMILSKLTIENSDELKKAVRYALDNPKVIAQLEYKHNNGQPIKITETHLDCVRQSIESESFCETKINTEATDATGDVPLEKFLLVFYALAMQKPPVHTIITDDRRKALISTIFGSTRFEEEILNRSKSVTQNKTSCTQIIFDSADVSAAIDQLIMNVSDRTWSSWRIQLVYVQESLKDRIHEMLTTEKLNAIKNLTGQNETAQRDEQENQKLAKQYGGNFVSSDDATICLLFNVPAKYLANIERTLFYQIPIVINFFRTTKELIQLMRTESDANKQQLTSIWTENIGLFYEVAADIDSNIIWSNCIGLFDPKMPLINSNFANTSKANNRFAFEIFFSLLLKKIMKSFLSFQFGFYYKYQREIRTSYFNRCIEETKIPLHSIWQNIR